MVDVNIKELLSTYDTKNITIATVCSHSSLQIFHGAKKDTAGFTRTYHVDVKTRKHPFLGLQGGRKGTAGPDLLANAPQYFLVFLLDGQLGDDLQGTVKRHTVNIFNKLGVENRMEAVAKAREMGLL